MRRLSILFAGLLSIGCAVYGTVRALDSMEKPVVSKSRTVDRETQVDFIIAKGDRFAEHGGLTNPN